MLPSGLPRPLFLGTYLNRHTEICFYFPPYIFCMINNSIFQDSECPLLDHSTASGYTHHCCVWNQPWNQSGNGLGTQSQRASYFPPSSIWSLQGAEHRTAGLHELHFHQQIPDLWVHDTPIPLRIHIMHHILLSALKQSDTDVCPAPKVVMLDHYLPYFVYEIIRWLFACFCF